MKKSKAQIIATIGPSSWNKEVLNEMIKHQMNVARFNMSWGDLESKKEAIKDIREISLKNNLSIPIIIDLSGPRVQGKDGHTFNHDSLSIISETDKEFIKFAVENKIEYVAISFVRNEKDIQTCRKIIENLNGVQKIIAKIERKEALESLGDIIKEADAVLIARGDLGGEIPLEQIPFVQEKIIKLARNLDKPVIVATQMMFSMTKESTPTRAEVTDVTNAILEGADAVMLSEETAIGQYPVEVVKMMEKIILESERHINNKNLNHL